MFENELSLLYRKLKCFLTDSYWNKILGNLGLRDQQLALQWVSDNIDRVGGDPNNITVIGHLAGAASAMYHLISERSRMYIQR